MRTYTHSHRVWDPLVRLFHWSLVLCMGLNWFYLEEGDPPHEWAGYVACAWVAVRFVWGFVGPHHARFTSFWPSSKRLRAHMGHMWAKPSGADVQAQLGHNPLGALMMLALMALVLSLGVTGWLQTTDWFWGDDEMAELHEWLSNATMALVGLHVLAALIMSKLQGINLPRAMVTGKKEWN